MELMMSDASRTVVHYFVVLFVGTVINFNLKRICVY
jgi:hypothetical protein